MYEYIKGNIAELTPTSLVVETGGIGYITHISLHSFSSFSAHASAKVYIHYVVREDAHLLYGFAEPGERELFRHFISVNVIGANTAMMILSSYPPDDLRHAILAEDVNLLKRIKGIGVKTAQRVIIDLKDKVGKGGVSAMTISSGQSQVREEALAALEMLGYNKKSIEKQIDQLMTGNPGVTVENLIKIALKSI